MMIDMKAAKEILRLQNELNTGTAGKDWKSGMTDKGRKIDWQLCVAMETAELIDSLNWKHWKDIDAPDDIENAKMELVDILHFLASWALENHVEDEFEAILSTHWADWTESKESTVSVCKELLAIASSDDKYRFKDAMACFKDLLSIFEFEDEIYSIYLGKNVLNKFRQDHGYKDGSYVKLWDGEEDNAFMTATLKEVTPSAEELYTILQTKYDEVTGSSDAIS